MVDQRTADPGHWMSLSAASRLLAVNQATLRQWANNGYLRVYRTPGGHRRFLRDDVLELTQGRQPAPSHNGGADTEGSALRRIRRRLQQDKVAQQPWYQSVEEEGRVRMRLFGRRLLSLLLREPSRRHRQEALAESLMLGHEYGSEMVDRGVPLRDTIEAFIFFRTMVLDSSHPRSWSQILAAADQVLVGVAEAYQSFQYGKDNVSEPGKSSRPIIQEAAG